MIEGAGGSGLVKEMIAADGTGEWTFTQNLDGNLAIEKRIASTIDHTHAASPNLSSNGVAA